MPRAVATALLLAGLLALTPGSASASAVVLAGPGPARTVEDPYLPADRGGPQPTGACRPDVPARASAAQAGRPTVSGTVDRAVAAGAVTAEQGAAWKAVYTTGRAAVGGLTGVRRAEQRGAVGVLEGLVLRGALPATRMPAAFLQLQRNTEWWTAHGPPPAPTPPRGSPSPCAGKAGLGGARVMFPGDPVVLQWYPGQGLALQPLATFGRANALWSACATPTPAAACHADQLAATLDRMVALGARRGTGTGFLAWEYLFAFGGGRAGWVSGIAQGTGIQALTRGAALLARPDLLTAARDAAGAFAAAAPVGVRIAADGGSHYLLYSFAPHLRVLNAFLQSLVGLHDLAAATGDPAVAALFAAGDRAARRELPRFDTGAWSRYSQGGAESDLGYHRLLRDFLGSLCDRTQTAAYCALRTRFTRYLGERTRVGLRVRRHGRAVQARVTLSKISCVTVRLTRGGRTVTTRTAVLPRGTRTLVLQGPSTGVEVVAQDLAGHRTTVRR